MWPGEGDVTGASACGVALRASNGAWSEVETGDLEAETASGGLDVNFREGRGKRIQGMVTAICCSGEDFNDFLTEILQV